MAAPGRIELSGDAARVWLTEIDTGRRFAPGDPIPPGRYAVGGSFADAAPIDRSEVWIGNGDAVLLQCDSAIRSCRPAPQR